MRLHGLRSISVLRCLVLLAVLGGLVLAGSVSALAGGQRAVYVECQNEAGSHLSLAVRPTRCILAGQPQTSASTVSLVNMHWTSWGGASATGSGTSVYTGMDITTRYKVKVRLFRVVQGCGVHGSRPYYYTDAQVTVKGPPGTLELPFNSC